MFEEYLTLWHFKVLVLYILANSALPWYAMWHNRCLKPDPKRDIERFKPFVRLDYHTWKPWLVPFTHFFFLIRFGSFILVLFSSLATTKIITLGSDINNLSETRRKLIVTTSKFWLRVILILLGYISWTTRRPKVDYSKWLGPEWKPTYEGVTMLVSNHTGFLEIIMTFLCIKPMPGFIAKNYMKTLPSVGPICTAIGTLFMERSDKNNRKAVFE